jgi:prepilin-type N-terminal cleavage/methylation domain-containing protein
MSVVKLEIANSQAGFTLVELIMAISLTAIVGVVLLTILIQNNGLFINETTKISHGLSSNAATTEISDTIRSATAIVNVCPSPTCTTTYSSSNSTLVVAVPAIDASNNAVNNIYDYIVITADSTNSKVLKKIIYVDPSSTRKSSNKMLANNLSLLQFYYLDQSNKVVSASSATKINYVINFTQQVGVKNQVSSSSGQINLRNF